MIEPCDFPNYSVLAVTKTTIGSTTCSANIFRCQKSILLLVLMKENKRATIITRQRYRQFGIVWARASREFNLSLNLSLYFKKH